jgi:hypothetical protein
MHGKGWVGVGLCLLVAPLTWADPPTWGQALRHTLAGELVVGADVGRLVTLAKSADEAGYGQLRDLFPLRSGLRLSDLDKVVVAERLRPGQYSTTDADLSVVFSTHQKADFDAIRTALGARPKVSSIAGRAVWAIPPEPLHGAVWSDGPYLFVRHQSQAIRPQVEATLTGPPSAAAERVATSVPTPLLWCVLDWAGLRAQAPTDDPLRKLTASLPQLDEAKTITLVVDQLPDGSVRATLMLYGISPPTGQALIQRLQTAGLPGLSDQPLLAGLLSMAKFKAAPEGVSGWLVLPAATVQACVRQALADVIKSEQP